MNEDKIVNKIITKFETQGYQQAMKEIKNVAEAEQMLSTATSPMGWAKTRGHIYKNLGAMRYLRGYNPKFSAFRGGDLFKSSAFKKSLESYIASNINNSIQNRLKSFNPNLSAFKTSDVFKSNAFQDSLQKYVSNNINSSMEERLSKFNPNLSAFKSKDVFKSPAFQRSMEEYVIDNIGYSLEQRFSKFNPRTSAFKTDELSKSPAFQKSLEQYVISNIDRSIQSRLSKFDPSKSAFKSAEFVKTPAYKKAIESTVLSNIDASARQRMAFDPKKSAFSGVFRKDLGAYELQDQLKKYEGILNQVSSFQKEKLSEDTKYEQARKALRDRVLSNITSQREISASAAHSRAITAIERSRISTSFARRINLDKFQRSYGTISGLRAGGTEFKSTTATYRHLSKLNIANKKYNNSLRAEKVLKERISNRRVKMQKGGIRSRFGGGLNAYASRAMLWMGLVSLTSYVIRGVAERAMQLGDAISASEIDVLKGQGYRSHYKQRYGSARGFDEAARYHSYVSGEGEYMGRSRIATIAGGLEASNIKITPQRLKDIVTAAQGISILKNTDFDNAYEGVIGILTKRRTPEEEKLVGVKGGGTPEQLLGKILDHLRNNPTTAGILGKSTLKATMQSIRSAPKAMLADVFARRPQQTRRGFETFGERWGNIFSTDTEDKIRTWTSVMESWNQVMESFDLQSNTLLVNFLKDTIATISFVLQGLGFALSNFDKPFRMTPKKLHNLFNLIEKKYTKGMPPLNTGGYTLTPRVNDPTIVGNVGGGYGNLNRSTAGATNYNTFKVDSMTVSENAVTDTAIMTQIP